MRSFPRSGFALFFAFSVIAISGCGSNSKTTCGSCITNVPFVSSSSPAGGATGVAVNTTVTATFDLPMNAATLTTTTFTLASSGGAVTGTVSYSSGVATFTPSAALAYNTQYTATITTGAESSGGGFLSANYTWSFTTQSAPAPTVTGTSPANSATGVAISSAVSATFSEAMSASTLTASTFTLASPGGAVNGTVAYDSSSNTATFTPSSALAYNTQFTATVTTGAQSSSGAALATNYTWSFTTAAAPIPTVTAELPASGAVNVTVGSAITATFSEAMNASSLTSSTFTLSSSGGAATGTVAYDAGSETATFTPSSSLSYATQYTATITTGATASNGAALASAVTWQFTTEAAPTPPTVTGTTPASSAVGVAVNAAVTATFSEAMNASSISTASFTLKTQAGTSVNGSVSYDAATQMATFTPSANLSSGATYTATLTTAVTNSTGQPLAANYTWSFTTAGYPVTVDFGTTYQTIRGFGGSTAWLGPMPTAVATELFGSNGLNLSILRLRIDPEGSASGGGLYGAPYETSQWDQELINANEAVGENPNVLVFASPWTPPAAWKLSGTSTTVDGYTYNEAFASCTEGTGYCGGYLDPNHYSDYANFLEDFVRFIDADSNANLYAISMQNEPDANETYESCVWTPQQMDTWVASLTAGGATNPITTNLMMPESQDFNPNQAATTLNDANAQANVSIVAGHIYQTLFGGSIAPYSIPAGDSPKDLWMTEFGPLSTATPSWSQALSPYALDMHNAMVTGQYNAYVWWGLFGSSTGNCATSAGTCGLVDHAGNVTVMGDVMGQYSKFIQPGYKRASATATPVSNVYVSAYTGQDNSGGQHYVIVVINTATSANTLTLTLDNASGVTSLTPWQSTSSAGLQQQPAVTVTNGQLTYTLPASSITTLVQ
ncbi:MAG: Ig-like domain-containing protein [Acidobacteriaceae bacterium]